jgi:hypothetical protein
MRKPSFALASAALTSIGVLAGCASHPAVPVADLTRAHTLVTQAQMSDAPRYDSVDLAAAQDKLQQADSNSQSHPMLAGQLAQEASADAQLSMARTRARKAQASLAQVNDSLTALRQQTSQVGEGTAAQAEGAAQELPATPPPAPQGGQ